MTDVLLIALAVGGWLLLFVGACALAYWLVETRHLPFVGVPVGCLLMGLLTGLGVWGIQTAERNPGEHKWKGGDGPETECHYEVQDDVVMAGKVPIHSDNVYTVCKS